MRAEGRINASSRTRRLVPLALATMSSQALLVVLAPTIVEVGREFGASIGAVGQARSTLAGAAIASSLVIAPFLDRLGIRLLLLWGAVLAIAGSAGAALSPSLAAFLSVHALIGVGFACLLSAGFAGVAVFSAEDRAWLWPTSPARIPWPGAARGARTRPRSRNGSGCRARPAGGRSPRTEGPRARRSRGKRG